MIGPSGGSPLPQLWVVLWWATLALLVVAGLVAGQRRLEGNTPAMNLTVRLLGAIAAVCFAGYWVETQDRRDTQALFDDVITVLEIDDREFNSVALRSSRVLCKSTNRVAAMTSVGGFVEHAKGPAVSDLDVPIVAVEDLEVFGSRLEDRGWTVRRFRVGGAYELWASGQDGYVLISLRPSSTGRYSLLISKDDCQGRNVLPVEADGVTLEPFTTELDTFQP